jgi:hypothetical protein
VSCWRFKLKDVVTYAVECLVDHTPVRHRAHFYSYLSE